MLHWLRQLSSLVFLTPQKTKYPTARRRRLSRARLGIEPLETRTVPASLLAISCEGLNLQPMVVDDVNLFNAADLICTNLPTVTVELDPAFDTGSPGDMRTELAFVNLIGQTGANLRVQLLGTDIDTTADANGRFTLSNVPLAPGVNDFTVRAISTGGLFGQAFISVTRNSAPTVNTPLATVNVLQDAPDTVLDLTGTFADVDILNSLVRAVTSRGVIDIELFDNNGPENALSRTTPRHVTNFLNYINSGRYQDTIFHRSVSDFVLQGGGFRFDDGDDSVPDDSALPSVITDAPVQNEPGISNTRGTVALAKLGGNPSSGTSQFFVNLGNNAANLDNQNGGFTVFGRVTGDGMAVVDALAAIPTQPRGGAFDSIPLVNFPQDRAFPDELGRSNLALVRDILVRRLRDTLTFTATSNNNGLVTASINGNTVRLVYQPGQTGMAVITVRATDANGAFVETMFTVNVTPAAGGGG